MASSTNSTAAMCVSRQLVAPFIERVREYLPEKTKRVKLTYSHDTLPVVFEFVFRWEKQQREVYDSLADAWSCADGSIPTIKGRMIKQYVPMMEIVRMSALDDDGMRKEDPEILYINDIDMIRIMNDNPCPGLYRRFGSRHKTCDRIKLNLNTAESIKFQQALSDNVGLNDMWKGENKPIITDVMYIDTKTLRIKTHMPMSREDWNVDIKYYGY